MTYKDFAQHFTTLSNLDLITILDQPENYEPSAVDAAKAELLRRNLSEADIHEARGIRLHREAEIRKQKEKIIALQNNIKRKGEGLLETLNPIQKEISTVERTIRFIVVVFGLLAIYGIINYFNWIIIWSKDFFRNPFVSFLVLLEFILLPIGVCLFWKKKLSGWILFVIYLVYSMVAGLSLLAQSNTWRVRGVDPIDRIFRPHSPILLILHLLFLGSTLYVLCQQNMKEVYAINKKITTRTILFTFVLSFLSLIVMQSS